MATKKHPKPVHVRAKVGLRQGLAKRMDKSQAYLSAQASADPQNKLGTAASVLSGARSVLVKALQTKANLKAQLDVAQADLILAIDGHDAAMRDYADAAAKEAGGDASALATFGVEAAANPTKDTDAVAAPATLTITPGAQPGEAQLKCGRVARAGAYEFQYKLEPSQPTDPWLPGATTTYRSSVLAALAPGQKLRARARAIGAAPGPWSAETIGNAK